MTNLLHVNATVSCPHGGTATLVPSQPRVTVSTQPAASLSGQWVIVGCAFTAGTKPQPCVTIRWITPAARVSTVGQNVVTQASSGICLSAEQIPQGPPVISVVQQRAKAL
jgi:hypothetical protein